METAFDAAAAIVEYDAGAIALYDKERSRHSRAVRVRRAAKGSSIRTQLAELEFKDNAGLAVDGRQEPPLPARRWRAARSVAPIYTQQGQDRRRESLLVLPLSAADEAIGTLTLVARAEKRFGKDVREMLAVIANQVAVALQNGFLYKKMETMATTDGLTGLDNHRTFQERFEDMLQRARRHGHKVALLLCDIDHFKKVNDNYGHPIGDEVLRRVAKVLPTCRARSISRRATAARSSRCCSTTSTSRRPRRLAERIRIEIAEDRGRDRQGSASVTESIGVASFPDDGRDRATLIERADLALYHAKHTGRNRVVTWSECQAAKAKKAG